MRKLLAGLAAGALALGAAACSAGPDPGPVTAPAQVAPPAPAGPDPAQPGPVRLAVDGTALGPAVTTDGWTVYRFEADTPEPPTSLCENDCLRAWPPLLTDGTPPQLDGIDPALVGTLTRADGTVQVTLGGWPLYRFVDDTAPGDTAGEGVGGNWSAIAADGKPLVKK
jgi:predicted lipoprotein with Yx(FWY)xxD motif